MRYLERPLPVQDQPVAILVERLFADFEHHRRALLPLATLYVAVDLLFARGKQFAHARELANVLRSGHLFAESDKQACADRQNHSDEFETGTHSWKQYQMAEVFHRLSRDQEWNRERGRENQKEDDAPFQ